MTKLPLLLIGTLLILQFTACKKDPTEQVYFEYVTGDIPLSDAAYNSLPECDIPLLIGNTLRDTILVFPKSVAQGCVSSDAAFAVGYGLMSYYVARYNNDYSYTTNTLMSPAYLYNQTKQGDCTGGSSIKANLDLLKTKGVCTWDLMPYELGYNELMADSPCDGADCTELPTAQANTDAQDHQLFRYEVLKKYLRNARYYKEIVKQGYPIIFNMDVYDGFANYYQVAGNATEVCNADINSGNLLGSHAMVVIGYNDQMGPNGALRIWNSWGTDFADGGEFWIDYKYFVDVVKQAYVAYYQKDVVLFNPWVLFSGVNDCYSGQGNTGSTWNVLFEYHDPQDDIGANSTVILDCLNCYWGNDRTIVRTATPTKESSGLLRLTSYSFCAHWGTFDESFRVSAQLRTTSGKQTNRVEMIIDRPAGADKVSDDTAPAPFVE